MEEICKTKSQFFGRVNKIDRPLARLTRRKRRTQINKINNGKGNRTTDTTVSVLCIYIYTHTYLYLTYVCVEHKRIL